jgi:subtilisin family serine protease
MNYDKLTPGVTVALQTYRQTGPAGMLRHSGTLGVSAGAESAEVRMPMFLYCTEDADLSSLSEHGIAVHQREGTVRTAFVPIESVDPLSEHPEIHRILSSHRLRPLLNVASQRCSVPRFRIDNPALSGQGVIVGIIDTGIDPHHPAFAGRILRIWDQTLQGLGVAEGAYGRELAGALLTRSRDLEGHGTHVAGIAAGDDANFGGLAPAAELVIVKTDFQNTSIADGLRYVTRVAAELGRPVVINLSLGGHFNGHDGADPLSLVVDSVSAAGAIVCCAAGNEGNDNIHGQVTIPAGGTRSLRFRVPAGAVGAALVTGWYASPGGLEVGIRSPSGFTTPLQGIIAAGNPAQSYLLPDAKVVVTTPDSAGDRNFLIDLGSQLPNEPVAGGVWRLVVRNPSPAEIKLDVWTLDGADSPQVVFSGTSAKDSLKIGSPGAAASAVTVASFTTRIDWNDVQGSHQSVGLILDDISDFSSEGPLRNGALKPDVTAPGAMIVSCLSADSSSSTALMVTQDFRVNAGTSMATPFISGLVALLLQRDPNLDVIGVKALLRAHSAIPGQPPGTHDPKWGFGLVDTTNL